MGEPPRRWRTSRTVKKAARELRGRTTPAEEALWAVVRRQQIDGLQFRRQHPIGPFVLDFYCPSQKLCIELDGPVHDGTADRDEARTDALNTLGIRVIRFRNDEVLGEIDAVIARIRTTLHPASTLPPRPA